MPRAVVKTGIYSHSAGAGVVPVTRFGGKVASLVTIHRRAPKYYLDNIVAHNVTVHVGSYIRSTYLNTGNIYSYSYSYISDSSIIWFFRNPRHLQLYNNYAKSLCSLKHS